MMHLLVLILLLGLRLTSAESSCNTNTYVGSFCVASLVRDLLAVPGVQLNASEALRSKVEGSVDDFLERCLGISAARLRPVNILLMFQSQDRGAADLSSLLLSQTGFQTNLSFVDIYDLITTVITNLGSPLGPTLDGFAIDPSAVVDLTELGALAPMEDFVMQDPQIAWADVLPFFRQVATIYDGHLIAVPFTGQVSVLYYRKDLLARHNLSVPATWEDLLDQARKLNGTDLNGDGEGDYAICWQMKDCLEAPVLLVQVAAPFLQSMGTAQGWMFDPSDMSLLLNSTAMLKAMGLLRELQKLVPPDVGCEFLHLHFLRGACAFTIKWSEQFKATQLLTTALQGLVGVAQLPGSTEVLNRATRQLEPCTPVTCPYATNETSHVAGRKVLVNRAPHFGFGGFGGAARKGIDPGYQKAVYDFFAYLAGPALSWAFLLDPMKPVGPFRLSHVDMKDETNFKRWTDAGYHPNDTRDFLQAWTDSIRNPNVALDIRILNSFKYRRILFDAASALLTDVSPEAIMADMASQFAAVLASTTGNITTIQAAYRTALGHSSTSPLQPPPEPAPSPATCCSSGSYLHIYPPIVAVTLVVLLTLGGYWLWSRAHSRSLCGSPLPPKGCPETTLLVATLPDLPALLRDLPEPVMIRTLAQYLSQMRRLLRKYRGYEAVPAATPEDVLDMASDPSMSLAANAAAAARIRSAAAATAAAAAATTGMSKVGHAGTANDANAAAAAAAAALAAAPLTPEGALQLGALAAESWFMLCVFRTPRDAIRFADAAQQGLMRLDWPSALLQHRKCESLYALPAQHAVALADMRARVQLAGDDAAETNQSPRLLKEPHNNRAEARCERRQQHGGQEQERCSSPPAQTAGFEASDRVLREVEGDRSTSAVPSSVMSCSTGPSRLRVWVSGAPLLRLVKHSGEVSVTARALLGRRRVLQLFSPSRSITGSSIALSTGGPSFRETPDATLEGLDLSVKDNGNMQRQQSFQSGAVCASFSPSRSGGKDRGYGLGATSPRVHRSAAPVPSIAPQEAAGDVAAAGMDGGPGPTATAAEVAEVPSGLRPIAEAASITDDFAPIGPRKAAVDVAAVGMDGGPGPTAATAEVAEIPSGLGPIAAAAAASMKDDFAPALNSEAYRPQPQAPRLRVHHCLSPQSSAPTMAAALPPTTGIMETADLMPPSPFHFPAAAACVTEDSASVCISNSRAISTGRGTNAGGVPSAATGSVAPFQSAAATWVADLPDPLGSSVASFSMAGSRTASFAQRCRGLSRLALLYSTSVGSGTGGGATGSVGGGEGVLSGAAGGSVRSSARPPSRQWGRGGNSVPGATAMPRGESVTSQAALSTDAEVMSSVSTRQPSPVPPAPVLSGDTDSISYPFLDSTAAAAAGLGKKAAAAAAAEGSRRVPDRPLSRPHLLHEGQAMTGVGVLNLRHPSFTCMKSSSPPQSSLPPQPFSGGGGGGTESAGQVPALPKWLTATAATVAETDAAAAHRVERDNVTTGNLQVVRLAQYYRAAYKVVNAKGQLMTYFKPAPGGAGGHSCGSQGATAGGGGGGRGGRGIGVNCGDGGGCERGEPVAIDPSPGGASTNNAAASALNRCSPGNLYRGWPDRSKGTLLSIATCGRSEAHANPKGPLKRTFSDPVAVTLPDPVAVTLPESEDDAGTNTPTPPPTVPAAAVTAIATGASSASVTSAPAVVSPASAKVAVKDPRKVPRVSLELLLNAETAATPSMRGANHLDGRQPYLRHECPYSFSQGREQGQQQRHPMQQESRKLFRQSLLNTGSPDEAPRPLGAVSRASGSEPARAKARVMEAAGSSKSLTSVRQDSSRRVQPTLSRESSGLFRSRSIVEAEGRVRPFSSGLAGPFASGVSDEEPEPEPVLDEALEASTARSQLRAGQGNVAPADGSSRRRKGGNPSRRHLLLRPVAVAAAAVAAVTPLRRSLTAMAAGALVDEDDADAELELLLADVGVLVQRGLRVCMGLSSGVAPRYVSFNRAAKRMQYGGPSLHVARAVSYAAHGTASRFLLSGMAYKQLGGGWSPVGESGRTYTVLNIGEYKLRRPYDLPQPLDLYMPLNPSQGPCLASHRRPRGAAQTQAGVMEAPLGDATIVFVNVVGVSSIMAWDVCEAKTALALFQSVSTRQLAAFGGYLVELVDGLCLAAFTDPAAAIRWGLTVLSRLLSADWSPKLLEHELCEEVVVSERRQAADLPTPWPGVEIRSQPQRATSPSLARHHHHNYPIHNLYRQQHQVRTAHPQALTSPPTMGSTGGAAATAGGAGCTRGSGSCVPLRRGSIRSNSRCSNSNHFTRVLYRGLRLKIGIDVGPVKAEVSSVTGRVAYRGRAMNRAARIASKAPAGQLWCSGDVWRACGGTSAPSLLPTQFHQTHPYPCLQPSPNLQRLPSLQAMPPLQPTPPPQPQLSGAAPVALLRPSSRSSATGAVGGGLFPYQGDSVSGGGEDTEAMHLTVLARYQGRHQLKGVAEPMDLWSCRFEGSTGPAFCLSPAWVSPSIAPRHSIGKCGEVPNPGNCTANSVAARTAANAAGPADGAAVQEPRTPENSSGGGSIHQHLQVLLQDPGCDRRGSGSRRMRYSLEMGSVKTVETGVAPAGCGGGGVRASGDGSHGQRLLPVLTGTLGRGRETDDGDIGPPGSYPPGGIRSLLSRSTSGSTHAYGLVHSQSQMLTANPTFTPGNPHSASAPRVPASRLRRSTLATHATSGPGVSGARSNDGGTHCNYGSCRGSSGSSGGGKEAALRSVTVSGRDTIVTLGSPPRPDRQMHSQMEDTVSGHAWDSTATSTLALEMALQGQCMMPPSTASSSSIGAQAGRAAPLLPPQSQPLVNTRQCGSMLTSSACADSPAAFTETDKRALGSRASRLGQVQVVEGLSSSDRTQCAAELADGWTDGFNRTRAVTEPREQELQGDVSALREVDSGGRLEAALEGPQTAVGLWGEEGQSADGKNRNINDVDNDVDDGGRGHIPAPMMMAYARHLLSAFDGAPLTVQGDVSSLPDPSDRAAAAAARASGGGGAEAFLMMPGTDGSLAGQTRSSSSAAHLQNNSCSHVRTERLTIPSASEPFFRRPAEAQETRSGVVVAGSADISVGESAIMFSFRPVPSGVTTSSSTRELSNQQQEHRVPTAAGLLAGAEVGERGLGHGGSSVGGATEAVLWTPGIARQLCSPPLPSPRLPHSRRT